MLVYLADTTSSAPSDLVIPAACACLGVLVGFVMWYFLIRFDAKSFTIAGLGELFGVVLGGGIVAFLLNNLKADSNSIAWYAIGLFGGSVLYVIAYIIVNHKPPILTRQ